MADFVVKSADSSEELQRKASQALGGQNVRITERSGGERVLSVDQQQADQLNRMQPQQRNEALGGNVRQMLND